ncbi:MAG TPA: SDR family NAD(P)-dependent oxidoreductase [Candidatus Bathyarchaeia archaeon]|nr:SDR family NAD(P)-dependent oxidoreductase [Candidatus Bathyarchaeia archaeon]
MVLINDFDSFMQMRKPILAYNPPGILSVDLLKTVIREGGVGLVNLERMKLNESKELLNVCLSELQNNWGIRISNKQQLELLLNLPANTSPILLITSNLDLTQAELEKIKTKQFIILAEVTNLQEAYSKKWASSYIVKGYEAGGRIGNETSFILSQQFADAGLSFIVQGGVGLYTSPAIFIAGAKAIVLDTQLYLTPECPLPQNIKDFLSKLDATDTRVLGDSTNYKYRVYARLGTKIVNDFIIKEKELLTFNKKERTEKIQNEISSQREMFESNNFMNNLLPMGQDISFAKILTDEFGTVTGIINGLLRQIEKQIKSAITNYPLQENNLISKELGIRYPIIQGPMANVSESPVFAKLISDAGGLPFLALGSLFKGQTRTLITKTKEKLGDAPFGCGIIGLEANKKARDEHLKIIQELKPPFVVVAAGTIDQAKEVMGYGIKTFLHTPSPAIFREAFESGVSNLVLEGMECGGHIGVLTSFVLWELSLHELSANKEKITTNQGKINVAFAGGIGDKFSAAMAGILCSAHPEIMNGLLWVGTAYILVKEIVETDTIQPLYQQLALNAKETVVVGETVNTRARSIPTPFTKVIIERELARLKEGVSLADRKHQYERDNLGSTRIAALGEIWNPEGEDDKPNRFMPIDEKGQYQKGNYLIGQIIASLRCIRTLDDLHTDLIINSEELVKKRAESISERLVPSQQKIESSLISDESVLPEYDLKSFEDEGIAIVGLGCVFPDALNINAFWNNILNKVYSIKEIPSERWADNIDLFYDQNKDAPNKSYTKIAASISNFNFNSLEFKIPPKVAITMGRAQKLALVAAKEALEDAKMLSSDYDHSRTAVIIGNSMGDEIRTSHSRKVFAPEVLSRIEKSSSFSNIDNKTWEKIKTQVLADYETQLVPINEDTMPGELSNVIAGRISNTFNLRGKNMTTDAACASSLAALNVAAKGLLDFEYDIVLCGGADCSLDPPTFIKFAKIGALSAEGSYPFDDRANGFVMGEGAGFCILKRLSDATRDGDKIYAVVRGMGASSDGRGKGITAPNPSGQKLAIERALEQAKIKFSDIQLVEAHGTSTIVGDAVELQVLNEIAKNVTPGSIAIGSIKSQIGHLKSAAGIASLIKTALALHHKTLPPSVNFEKPNQKIDWKISPFYVNVTKNDWNKPATDIRIAGISAFGFGGTNYHAILEEYIPGKTKGYLPKVISIEEIQKIFSSLKATKPITASTDFEEVFDKKGWQNYYQKNVHLETEALFIGASSNEKLLAELQRYQSKITATTYPIDGIGLRIRDLAFESLSALSNKNKIGFTANSVDDIPTIIKTAIEGLNDKTKRTFLQNKGIFYSDDHSLGKIAFLFPGQGSQYVRMGKELWDKYEIVRETFREADEITQKMMNFKITEAIFAIGKNDDKANELLKQTEITQPAIFVLNIAIYRLLESFGIKPDFVAGHSLGEYSALVSAGILSFGDGLRAVVPRGQAMAEFSTKDKGIMASVSAGYEEIDELLQKIDGYVICANKNTPNQTVISGATKTVKAAMKIFAEKGIQAIQLPVSAAFHSKIVAPAVDHLRISLEKLTFNKPKMNISSNVTGKLYPTTRDEIINLLCEQISSPVEWIKQIKSMYEDYGVKTFIEIGPKYVLTSFTRAILDDKKDYFALASNHPKKGAMQHFNEVIAALGTFGYPLKIPSLNDNLYADEFRNPLKRFFIRKPIERQTSVATIVKESPFDVLLDQELEKLTGDSSFKDYLELQGPAISAFLKVGYNTYKDKIASAIKEKEEMDKLEINTEPIGVTGISIGLPGKNRHVFDDSNFDAILNGQNFIEKIPLEFRNKMVDKNIVRLVKDAVKGAQFQTITDVKDVIKLAAQKGEFDLSKEYGIDVEFTSVLDITFQLAFAAGIEALRDAGIPLVPMKTQTSVGKEITKGWALPESLRDDTGIVFASAFPGYSNLISIISKYLTDKYSKKNKEEKLVLYQELINQISNESAKKQINTWFEKNKTLLTTEETHFEFSRKFLFEILSMGHSQFAQLIRARGPNTQVNAACSSTTQAIAIGEDWIRNGRCNRVIVIAADDVTNDEMLEWIASGFLAVGAATTKEKVEEAALPFDNRRHGMIIGMGAAGIILESDSVIKARGVKPIADLLGTHIVNSAFHGTRLDRDHISSQVDEFISKIEKRYKISREEIARQLVFVSHETYTPARGGSASAEIDALRRTFGNFIDNIVIANTKGFTGHAMGAGIEDVVAIKILEKGIVPPVANWKEQDPELGKLNLSKGGKYDVKYALRFAAGFGSQLTLALFRVNTQQNRFQSGEYDQWLQSLHGSRQTLEVVNKTLRLNKDPSLIQQKQIELKSEILSTQASSMKELDKDLLTTIVNLISEKTGYPVDMIEPNMHLEEDLGIDTVKQAELFGLIRTKYNLPREEGVRIQEYSSVNKIAEYISSKLSPGTSAQKDVVQQIAITDDKVSSSLGQKDDIVKEITNMISEKTGYPVEMIEPEMELEEDLGIDTVKQAEMFGIIRTKWNLPREEGIKIQEYSTVNKIADYILNRLKGSETKQTISSTVDTSEASMDEIIPAKRLAIQLIEAPLPKVDKLSLSKKKFIIVGESNQFSDELLEILRKQKATIVNVLDIKKINSETKLKQELPTEEIDGLIYIEPKTTQNNKHNNTARTLFLLCKLTKFSEKPFILTINNSDSAFGWEGKTSPITGSITGLTKSLAREFSKGIIRTVSCLKPEQAISELISGDGSIEISYDKAGNRRIFATQESPISTKQTQFKPTSDDLIIISGGAQGITYEITKKIAEKYKTKLALLGRTKLPENIDELVALDQNGLDNLKAQMIEQLKAKEDKVTPVIIEKEWSKITKAISVKKALNYLIKQGSPTRYYSVDVINNEEMVQTIQKITKDFKQIVTGIVHGAGLESSKLIGEKKIDDFDNVYNVKAIGFDNLLTNLDVKQLKFVVCFSSVAGRFGNAGQVDYSAANDYLSKSCWQLHSQGLRAISVCWSAWDEIGMATRGSVMKILKYAGVTPLKVEDGVNAFIQELEYGQEAEIVIAGKLGVLLDSPAAFISIDSKSYPLIGEFKRNFDGSITAERTFSLENDLYLNHHRFEDIPYLPGVMGLELFVELARIMYPSKIINRFENVSFKSAVKFKNDIPRKLRSKLSFSNDLAKVILESDFEKDGVKLGETRTHFTADIVFGKKEIKIIDIPKMKSGYLVNNSRIYKILPHKELFRTLKGINEITKQIISIPTEVKGNQFAWDIKELYAEPLVIEAAFQTMGLLDIIKDNKLGLPFSIKSLQYYQTKEQPAYIFGTKVADTDFGSLYNFEVVTKTGQLLMEANGYATVHVDFGADLSGIDDIQIDRVKRLFSLPPGTFLEVNNVSQIKKMIESNPNLVTDYLHPDEIEHLKTLTIEKRRNEWLSGIIAVKKALQKYKPEIQINNIKIEKNELGKPFIKLNKNESIYVSITHSNSFAVGIINPSIDTGIDLEIIEKRDQAIIDELLSPKDQEFLQNNKQAITEELLTKIWSAKEAASKVLGVGLNIDLHDLIVSKYDEQEITIQVNPIKLPQNNKLKPYSKDIELSTKLDTNEEYVAAVCRLKSL